MQSDVLVVCTGNVCRSPYVAARLTVELPGLTVGSGGTGALVGEPPTEETEGLLLQHGIRVDGAVARSVDRAQLRGARLIVTAARRHRVEIGRLLPAAADRAYTLRELARILRSRGRPEGLGVDGVLATARDSVEHGEDVDHDDDLVDPYGRSEDTYFRMASEADEALAVLVPALRTDLPATT